jgi:glycosyltransferase involved in cell wall biosynthesis/putative methionine-R-sulfoxide reductase with GAF domain
MRVLMLVSEAPPIKSGIARVAGELTERLTGLGVEIDVLSANEIPRATFKEFRFSSLSLRWREIQKRLGEYDILHIHGSVPTFSEAALLLGRLGSRLVDRVSAVVYTHHCDIDLEGLEATVRSYNRMHRRLVRLADHVVASTPSYALRLEAAARPGRVSAVPFGVDFARFSSESEKPERFNVLFVGQLRPYKGVDVLLRAWSKVDNADLHIVGTGHERERLTALIQELGLTSVHLHGAVSDKGLVDYYSNAHVLVLPSTRKAEAFGLVLLEGMAAGCVPVASRLPGVTDVVGDTGMTFPVGDSDAMAEVLLQLRDDVDMRRRRSMLARKRALMFNWDYTARAYLDIYKQAYVGRSLELLLKGREAAEATIEPLQEWLVEVAHQTDADRASLMLCATGRYDMRIAASVGIDSAVVANTSLPIGQRIAGHVAKTGKPVLVRKLGVPEPDALYVTSSHLASSLVLPIRLAGSTVGVLNLARRDERPPFSDMDRRWLHRLSYQVAPLLGAIRLDSYGMAANSVDEVSRRVPYVIPLPSHALSATGQEGADDRSTQPAVSVRVTGYNNLDYQRGKLSAQDVQDILSVVTDGWGGHVAQGADMEWVG